MVWVGDLLLFASLDKIMSETKTFLLSKWEITDLGELNKMVGIEIIQKLDSITISQQTYIESILHWENLHEMHGTQSPMDLNIKLVQNPDDNEFNCSNSFGWLLGELQYIANSTWPNITYAVNKMASYTANPSLQHSIALKWILWYLARTKNFSITYSKNSSDTNGNISMVLLMLPMQIMKITNQPLDIFSWQQGEQWPGNPKSKPQLPYHLPKLNMWPYLKLDAKYIGLEICLWNSDILKILLFLSKVTTIV